MIRLLMILMAGISLNGCSENTPTFSDERLQGVLNGQPWRAEKVESIIFDFGARKEKQPFIYSEICEGYECLSLRSPSINLRGLDTSAGAGNLSIDNSVTIFNPPNDNIKVKEGVYRISRSGEKTKLELKFSVDNNNHVDGHILY